MRNHVAVATFVVLVIGCGGNGPSGPPSPVSSDAPTAAPPTITKSTLPSSVASSPAPAALTVLSTTAEGFSSKVMESGFGSVWAVSNAGIDKIADDGTISHVVSGTFADLAVGEESIFALKGGTTNELDELNPATGQQVHKWSLGDGAHSVALTSDAAYVIHSSYPATVDRVDLASGKSKLFNVAELATGVIAGQALAAGGGLIWSCGDGTTVYGFDPATMAVKVTGHVPTTATSVWFGGDGVWTSGDGYHQGIHRLDPVTGHDVADVLYDAIQLAFSERGVWASAYDGPSQLDPATAAVVAVVPHGQAPSNYASGTAVLNGKVFVSYYDTGQLQVIAAP